jgi:hypothetical protein
MSLCLIIAPVKDAASSYMYSSIGCGVVVWFMPLTFKKENYESLNIYKTVGIGTVQTTN